MQKYTLTVLINEKVSDAARSAIFESLKKHFSSLIKEDIWGVRSLAYDIKHANKAFYAHFEFETDPMSIITLDKNIRLNEDIIRYLIVKVDDKRIKIKKTKKVEPASNASQSDAGGEKTEEIKEEKPEEKVEEEVKIKRKVKKE